MKSRSPKTLRTLAEAALKQAVRQAYEEHAKTNDPVVIYRNGKVVEISAKKLLRKNKTGHR